ncbi:ectoine/hydroxyectoine ABC transporter substrate-binding protein EhuB [Azospirillum sp.]|uniref:ectoine/hydroxyectoine ABC transporter substrate-binding protein EhuB n=1 Tax=Azospirillum sp. TaxID=34012 RepID=UPI002D6098F3|nr:ectoine/hydroxyectoine ABC transporter substrate-binding protein EhuB [Azospirillum sp.]HYD65431.1 ectoine/hydroxyectoine ABC transporter substrate-binding protein EhuB [Azospirillum sp.]
MMLALALGTDPALAETTLERIGRTGEVRIGYAPEVPFAFRTSDGQLSGIGPALARRVFARMDVRTVRTVESEFGALLRELKAGRFDVVAVGMFILPERCRQVIFSEPAFQAGTGFAVRPGNPRGLHSFEDVARDGSVRLGAVAGAVELDYARASGVTEEQLVIFPDAATAAAGVKAGRVDAYAAMALTVQSLVQRNPRQLERAEPFRNPTVRGRTSLEHGAYAFRPEDEDLRDAFNRHLAELLRTPEYLDLVAPFGLTRENLPDRTTAQLCAPSP